MTSCSGSALDMLSNKDIIPALPQEFTINGKLRHRGEGRRHHRRREVPRSVPDVPGRDVRLHPRRRRLCTGQCRQWPVPGLLRTAAWYYLKQFHPTYADKEYRLDADAKAAGFDNWRSMLVFKQSYPPEPRRPGDDALEDGHAQ